MSSERVASALLLHVSLLLTLYGGAGLVTCARLKWDPTLYVAVRELLPREFRALCVLLAAAAAALLALGHVAVAALAAPSLLVRRMLLVIHALGTAALVAGELAAAWWLRETARAFLRSAAARELREALQLREHLRPLLLYAARWHPAPHHLRALLAEVEEDVPRNWYVACAAAALLLLLQAVSLTLGVLLIARARSPAPPSRHKPRLIVTDRLNNNGAEAAPLMPAYRGGRLVLL